MALICTLSSEPCQDPVVSPNGDVYERRLIESYIKTTGTDPITKKPLTSEELIGLKVTPSPALTRPKTAGQIGIPALLQSFQAEWDAVMLESFNLKQQLNAAQQELSHALYQHDAACRVIARLVKEKEELKSQLDQLQLIGSNSNDKME